MRLATFLESSREEILDAAIDFARSIPVLHKLDDRALRNHLPGLLEVISADLRSPQSRSESIEKSHGLAPENAGHTPAQTHGLLRARLGLSIEELVAEYRAMRSSVLRLWIESHAGGPEAAEDIFRFNESIDQAVAESVQFYAQERERWRQIFLGVLGHDLRAPLHAITLTLELLRAEAREPSARFDMLTRSVGRLTGLLDSLLEYSRSSIGLGMALQRSLTDLARACEEEVELQSAANPQARITFDARGDSVGDFDLSRLREALGNLISNAVKHGLPTEPTQVRLRGDTQFVRVSVENAGEIPPEEIEMLFEPLFQRDSASTRVERTHMGLGLFITRQIARAHGGDVVGACDGQRVRFTMQLPRQRTPPAPLT